MIALDTNILIYAESPDDADGRYDKAIEVIAAVSTVSGCIPLQAIAEVGSPGTELEFAL